MSAMAILVIWAVVVLQQGSAAPDQQPAQNLSEHGKEIFVARCAKCHDADLAKKLPDGTNLLDRLAGSKDPQSRIATRIKNADEQRAVMTYISPLLAHRSAR